MNGREKARFPKDSDGPESGKAFATRLRVVITGSALDRRFPDMSHLLSDLDRRVTP